MGIPRFRTKSVDNSQSILLGVEKQQGYPACGWINYYNRFSGTRQPESLEECWDYINPGPPYKEGHEFFLRRKTAEYDDSEDAELHAYFYGYSGKIAVGNVNLTEVTNAYNSYGPTAASWGAQAFKRFRPVQPVMNLGQTLGELRDFPSLFKLRLKSFVDLGSQYLNYQFGWRPFLKDLMDLISLQKNIEKRISFIRKNNKKWLHRSGNLRDETTSTITALTACTRPSLPSYLMWPVASSSTGTRTVVTTDRIWFEAVMKYYIHSLDVDSCESAWSSRLLRHLYGYELTPSLLWELTPWTWLTDWFVNIGDIYYNISMQSFDNLVAKYAYVMRHRSTTIIYSCLANTRMNPPICVDGRVKGWVPASRGPTLTCSASFMAECKERAPATQWGFGNEGDSLTDRQLAILIALGLQRWRP